MSSGWGISDPNSKGLDAEDSKINRVNVERIENVVNLEFTKRSTSWI